MQDGDVYRGIICKAEIIGSKKVMHTAQENARNLYNFVRYCNQVYNYRLRKVRGDWLKLGEMPKYPGSIGMWRAMKDDELYKSLGDKTAMYIIRHYDQMFRSWMSNVKSNPNARPPRYAKNAPPLTFEAGRTAKHLGMNIWRFTALSGIIEDRYIFAKLYLPPMTNPDRVKSIKILHDGRCAVSYARKIKQNSSDKVAGIDLGINRIATVAFETGESILYPGGLLLSKQRYFSKKIAKCKPSGYNENKTSKRKSERYWSYYEQWKQQKRLILDNLTSSIVNECRKRNVKVIIVGDLKGIRNGKDYGKEMNQKLHGWPFSEIGAMLTHKAEIYGISVEKIDEAYTSRTCAICGNINPKSARVERGLLICKECGTRIHADVNGAFNILKKYLPAKKQLGVVARLRGVPSTGSRQGTGESLSQIDPTFSAKFDLRNYAVALNRC